MEVGKKLRDARLHSGLTQELVAEKIEVSRQTISNWENEKSYPDIVSVIRLSDLYSVSLDDLLKGDVGMLEHLEESTNIVSSNRKLTAAIAGNVMVLVLLIVFNQILPDNDFFLAGIFCLAIISSSALFYQLIKRF
ncbi:MAG: helix-turn-helix transcriptional regulator [Eubacteriales bacterium]|nr:helix-turn-helix transcriptional regulator [Eubacteriales bacterium]